MPAKKCYECLKLLDVEMFIRKYHEKIQEFLSCNPCSVKIRFQAKKTYQRNINKKRSQFICNKAKCNYFKVNTLDPKGFCPNHHGFYYIFYYRYKNMIKCSRDRAKIDKNFSNRSKLDQLPSVQEIIQMYMNQNGFCFYCGITFDFMEGNRNPDALSVDRIDSKLSYNMENILLSCYFCNRAKNLNSIKLFILSMKLLFDPNYQNLEYYYFVQHNVAPNMSSCFKSITGSGNKNSKKSDNKWKNQNVFNLAHKQNFRCALTGFEFCLCNVTYCPFRLSLDRIDNNIKDHSIQSNCQLVCSFINFMRNDLSVDNFKLELEKRYSSFAHRNVSFYEKEEYPQFSETDVQQHIIKMDKIRKSKQYLEKALLENQQADEFKPKWNRKSDRGSTINANDSNVETENNPLNMDEKFLQNQRDFKNQYSHEEYFKRVISYLNEVPEYFRIKFNMDTK